MKNTKHNRPSEGRVLRGFFLIPLIIAVYFQVYIFSYDQLFNVTPRGIEFLIDRTGFVLFAAYVFVFITGFPILAICWRFGWFRFLHCIIAGLLSALMYIYLFELIAGHSARKFRVFFWTGCPLATTIFYLIALRPSVLVEKKTDNPNH